MHEVSVPVVSDSRAKRAYQSQGLKYLPSLQVAVGKKGNVPCFGDSGGSLFDSGGRAQVGITSHGAGGCGQARYPAVYTEVNNPQIGKMDPLGCQTLELTPRDSRGGEAQCV